MKKTYLPKYENELKKIERERAKIQDLTREYDFRENARDRLRDAKTDAERNAVLNEIREAEKKRDEIRRSNEKIYIKIKCLQHNAELTFISEIVPIMAEILKPYYGKSLGEKTREKIRNEIKEKYNISFYFRDNREMIFNRLNEYGYGDGNPLHVHASYNTPFLTDNKINDLSGVQIVTYKRPYIDNVNKHVNDLYKAYENAKKAYDEFSIKAGIYTALTVDGLKDIDKYNPKFYGII